MDPFPGEFEKSDLWFRRYQRNNKRHGLKNVRCFPYCSETHKVRGFCGHSILLYFDMNLFSQYNNKLQFFGAFQQVDAKERPPHDVAVGECISGIQLQSWIRSKTDVFRPYYEGVLDVQASSLSSDNFAKVVFNKEKRGWHYGWTANKHTCDAEHVFRVYVFCVHLNNSYECIARRDSPSFTMFCRRRQRSHVHDLPPQLNTIEHLSLRKREFEQLITEKPELLQTMAEIHSYKNNTTPSSKNRKNRQKTDNDDSSDDDSADDDDEQDDHDGDDMEDSAEDTLKNNKNKRKKRSIRINSNKGANSSKKLMSLQLPPPPPPPSSSSSSSQFVGEENSRFLMMNHNDNNGGGRGASDQAMMTDNSDNMSTTTSTDPLSADGGEFFLSWSDDVFIDGLLPSEEFYVPPPPSNIDSKVWRVMSALTRLRDHNSDIIQASGKTKNDLGEFTKSIVDCMDNILHSALPVTSSTPPVGGIPVLAAAAALDRASNNNTPNAANSSLSPPVSSTIASNIVVNAVHPLVLVPNSAKSRLNAVLEGLSLYLIQETQFSQEIGNVIDKGGDVQKNFFAVFENQINTFLERYSMTLSDLDQLLAEQEPFEVFSSLSNNSLPGLKNSFSSSTTTTTTTIAGTGPESSVNSIVDTYRLAPKSLSSPNKNSESFTIPKPASIRRITSTGSRPPSSSSSSSSKLLAAVNWTLTNDPAKAGELSKSLKELPPSCDLTGRWQRPESTLKELERIRERVGIPWLLRKLMKDMEAKFEIDQTVQSMRILNKRKLGSSGYHTYTLDGLPHPYDLQNPLPGDKSFEGIMSLAFLALEFNCVVFMQLYSPLVRLVRASTRNHEVNEIQSIVCIQGRQSEDREWQNQIIINTKAVPDDLSD